MSKNLFEDFPHLVSSDLIIRKMVGTDVDQLFEITNNDHVYQFAPHFLYKKSRTSLSTAIQNLGERDFQKKKWIIAGICLPDQPERVVGIAEIFDYDRSVNMVTIGYMIHESFWHQGIASKAVAAMLDYLFHEVGINRVQAFVMPENVNSQKVLVKNHFVQEGLIRQGYVWNGKGVVDLVLFSILKAEYEK